MTQTLINPRGVFHRESHPMAARPESLNGKVLGLVDNCKVNADVFLDHIQLLMTQKYRIPTVMRIRKTVAGSPAPYTDAFFEKCDIVVNAFGD